MLKNIIDTTTRHYRLTLAAIIGLFSILVIGNMTRWSIWFDEAFSAYLMRFNIVEITGFTAADVHPPLYYWLLKGWTSIFGVTEIGVRSMSLLFAIIAIVGVFVLVRRLLNDTSIALLASLGLAISPIIIRFAHEARMYTLVLAIVAWATYALVRATETGAKKWWVGYALLLTAGMLTHYFAAFAWLAHWAWRVWERRTGRLQRFWSQDWVVAHLIAVAAFAPWLTTAIRQFLIVQGGFWIPPVSAYTAIDYISNTFMYRQYGTVLGWWAIIFAVLVTAGIWLLVKLAKNSPKKHHSSIVLIVCLALVPPLLLVLVSMPPLLSSFIDRYVMYAQAFLVVLLAVAVAVSYRRKIPGTLVAATLIGSTMLVGIGNVYYYGNYNKNSNTSIRVKEVIREIHNIGEPGQPVIAASPWIYYEAAFYDSTDHQVYFQDSSTDYRWGSESMLRDSQMGKINHLDEFTKDHKYVWYLAQNSKGEVEPPDTTWKRVKSVGAYDYINDSTVYRASLFDTRPSEE